MPRHHSQSEYVSRDWSIEPASADRKASIGWTASDDFDSMMNRRSSSIGGYNRSGSLGLGGDESSRRPFVGGGSAAAYEAARADHYSSMGGKGVDDRSRSLGMGGSGAMAGMAVNPNQHYEMLKLHHMNLLNEIQETTLMMNLYQQQQLQQQQEALQREGGADTAPSGGFSGNSGGAGYGRTSIGGGDSTGSGSQRVSIGVVSGGGQTPGKGDELETAQEQQQELEERLRAIKEDIAMRQREAEELEAAAEQTEGGKRKAEKEVEKEETDGGDKKRVKTEKDGKKGGKGKGKGEKADK